MKRFTETSKWQEPWFRKLPPHIKCLWYFLHETCDSCGVVDPDWEVVSLKIGAEVSEKDLSYFDTRVSILAMGRLWICDFISLQCGKLSDDCRPHKAVKEKLREHKIDALYEEYVKGIDTPQEKEKDKEQEKDKEKTPGKQPKAESVEIVKEFCQSIGLPNSDAEWFWFKCEGNSWSNGGKPIKDWKATLRSWLAAGYIPSRKNGAAPTPNSQLRSTLENVPGSDEDISEAFRAKMGL